MTKQQIGIIGLMMLLALPGGIAAEYLEPGQEFGKVELINSLISLTLLFFWYYLDTERLRFKRTPLLNIGVVAIALIALPYYFFRSRGLKQGTLFTAGFLLLMYALNWIDWVGASITQHAQQH